MNILITGAGRGLGFQLTKQAVERGHQVVACVRDVSTTSGELQELAARNSTCVRIERMNVALEDEAAWLADKLQKDSVKLDGIINNASILLGREHKIATVPLEQFGVRSILICSVR